MVEKEEIKTTDDAVHDKAEEILKRFTEEEKHSPEVVLALLDLHFYLRGISGLEIPPETYQRYENRFKKQFETEEGTHE